MRMLHALVLLTGAPALTLSASDAAAAPKHYEIDPVHTRIVFAVDHLGFSKALGTFAHPRGSLRFDPDDWSTAKLEVAVPLANLDMGDADWRDKLLEPGFLDAKGQPEARFVSTRVEATDKDHARVTGQLSLRGVSQEVVFDVRLNALKRHPITFRQTAGFSASTRFSRRAFGITTWPNGSATTLAGAMNCDTTARPSGQAMALPIDVSTVNGTANFADASSHSQ